MKQVRLRFVRSTSADDATRIQPVAPPAAREVTREEGGSCLGFTIVVLSLAAAAAWFFLTNFW